jgi:hypothetical protein
MLAETLATLASTGGTALVTAMVTDSWEALRSKFARLLGRGDARAEAAMLARLDESRTALASAAAVGDSERIRPELEAAWRIRLEDLLERDSEVAEELCALVAEAQAAGAVAGRVEVHAAAFGQAQQAVQGQGVQNVTFSGQHGPSGSQR